MEKFKKSILVLMACVMVSFGGVFTSCEDDDDYNTDQIKGGVSLSAAQLQVTRGGYMQFKGSGLEHIQTIVFPTNVNVDKIEIVDKYTIRCLVPEEAMPGKVQLLYANGTLETGEIAFTEPITVESFAPAEVKPGDVLTIKGTYLTYITQVVFATGETVKVSNNSRTELKVTVPLDASTGKFTVAYETESDDEVILNEIPSETELKVVAPTITKVSAETIKAGSKLTIEGTQLNQILAVKFEGAKPDTLKAMGFDEVKSLTVAVPAEAVDGAVTLISRAGFEYKTPVVKILAPTVKIDGDAATYGVGNIVVLAGSNLDLIKKAQFNGADAVDVKVGEDGKIAIEVPQAAKSGDITLTLGNGVTMNVTGFITTKPVATLPTDEITPLNKLTIPSTLAERVVGVKFTTADGDETAEAEGKDGSFRVQVPLAAVSGKVVLVMDNGEEVEAGEIKIGGYQFCAISAFSDEDVTAGKFYTATVNNPEALVGVEIAGKPVQYIVSGNTLYVLTEAAMAGDQTMVLKSMVEAELVDVRYQISLLAAGKVETTIWTGDVNFTDESWGVSFTDLQWGKYDWSFLEAGYEITLYYTVNDIAKEKGYTAIRIGNGSWESCPSLINTVGAADGNINFDPATTSFTFTLTEEDVANLKEKGGLGVFGFGIDFVKLTYTVDYSAPTPIWEGSVAMDSESWGVALTELQWGNWDKYKENFVAGKTVYIYYEVIGAYTNIRLGDGSWVTCPSLKAVAGNDSGDMALDVNSTSFSFTLTAEDEAALQGGGGFGVFGYGIKLTKIAIK